MRPYETYHNEEDEVLLRQELECIEQDIDTLQVQEERQGFPDHERRDLLYEERSFVKELIVYIIKHRRP